MSHEGRRGIQAPLSRWFKMSFEPPPLPPGGHEWVRSFGPAPAFLRYLKLQYLILAAVLFFFVGGAGVALIAAMLVEGAPPVGPTVVMVVLALVAVLWFMGYAALQLQYDATWYVMTDRALRLRSGLWVQKELTVSFDNAQNVRVRRGPIQRWLGIGDVVVETAAAGAATSQQGTTGASAAVVAGVADPQEIRDRIVARMRASRSSGLGDDERTGPDSARADSAGFQSAGRGGWTPAHLALLREIREEVKTLRQTPP